MARIISIFAHFFLAKHRCSKFSEYNKEQNRYVYFYHRKNIFRSKDNTEQER